jgi:ABC-type Mn2+/Zn2+ transport system permease subunit
MLEPLGYSFMRAGLAASLLVGVSCACMGAYVVLRRMAFVGDALAHTTLPGLVIAYWLGLNTIVGAVGAALATALAIGWLARRQIVREDTAIGVAFTAMFALGVLMMTAARSYRDFAHMLFGNILGVTSADLVLMALVTVAVVAVLFLLHKELELTSFDATYARSIGLDPDRIRLVLLVLLALTVVVGIKAVGVVLTSALLITPAAAAALLVSRLGRIMALACVFAFAAGVAGLYSSYYLAVSSGAAIVLAATAIFGGAYVISIGRS